MINALRQDPSLERSSSDQDHIEKSTLMYNYLT